MIAANDEVTIFAMKNTFSKFQVLKMSAVGTFARRAFPAANFANRFSALEGDPFQNIHEAGKSKIGNLATPQSLHAVDVQIFKTHDIIFVAQIMSQLEMMLKPFVGNVRAMFGKRSPRVRICETLRPCAKVLYSACGSYGYSVRNIAGWYSLCFRSQPGRF